MFLCYALFVTWFLMSFELVLNSSCLGRESWMLCFNCDVAVCFLCLFLDVPCVGLWSAVCGLRSVTVAFHGHTHLLFNVIALFKNVKLVSYSIYMKS